MPKLVTPLITPSYSKPIWSCMKKHFNHAVTSREASSARRSLVEQWTPMASHEPGLYCVAARQALIERCTKRSG